LAKPTNVALANGFIVINAGGPTDDKPTIVLETPKDPGRISSFLNVRVPVVHARYATWSARGAQFLQSPKQHQYEIRLIRRGAIAVLEAAGFAAADRNLRDAYLKFPQDPALAKAARRLAARTAPEW
jgi:hypothetical protein